MSIVESLLNKIYNYYNNNNDILHNSIDIEISNVKTKLVEIEYKLSKTNDTINLLNKNLNEQELIYKKSKEDLNNFNLYLHNSILKYKASIVHLLDNENLKENLKTSCFTLKNLFNDFEKYEDLTIFEKADELNNIIEENVIKCEIAKEKLTPFKKNLKSLQKDKELNDNKLNKLMELKKSCDLNDEK